MKDSKIEWTHHTFNFVRGCTEVSEGCANCYARELAKRNPGLLGKWGKGQTRVVAVDAYWAEPRQWDRIQAQGGGWKYCPMCFIESQNDCPSCGWEYENMMRLSPRVFCASLADWLDEEIPASVLARLLKLIHETPCLDWLMLTKRPQNWKPQILGALAILRGEYETSRSASTLSAWTMVRDWLFAGRAPDNIWMGTTVENQRRAEERIPVLLSIPAKKRFLSCEPLLGPLNLGTVIWRGMLYSPLHGHGWTSTGPPDVKGPKIDWVICGGESGHKARPMDAKWVYSLRHQCQSSNTSFFFKQWGEWRDGKRLGKTQAGRDIDGVIWNELP